MKKLFLSSLVIMLTSLLLSCGGGSGTGGSNGIPDDNSPLYVSQINGASTLNEGATINYSVLASGVSGITYFWSSTPAAQAFDPSNASTTAFSAWSVDQDTVIIISVVVSAPGYDPVTRSKTVTIRNRML